MKKIFASVLGTLMLLETAVFAADIKTVRNIGAQTFEVSGTASAGSSITVEVYAPGKSDVDIPLATNPIDVVKYHNEVYADSDGTFSFTVRLDSVSGLYPMHITADSVLPVVQLEYVDIDVNDDAISGFNLAADKVNFLTSGTNRADLGFYNSLYDSTGIDQTKIIGMMSAKMPFDITNPQVAIDVFNEAVIAQALSQNIISGVAAQQNNLSHLTNGSKFDKWYKAADKAAVDARLAGKSFATLADFENALGEAILLEIVKAPNGYQNVKLAMADFLSVTGISALSDADIVYQTLAGNNYQTALNLKDAYDLLVPNAGVQGPVGGTVVGGGGSAGGTVVGGGSMGGGSAGGGSMGGGGLPYNNPEPVQPLEKHYFSDMESCEWAKPAVNYLAEREIISGKSENEFYPQDPVMREEFVAMDVRAFGFEKIADAAQFDDVTKDKWYYDCVTAANQNEIINGITDTLFGAGSRITRQDMAVILYRSLKAKNIELPQTEDKSAFADDADIAEYAKEAVYYLKAAGVISGMGDNCFMPMAEAQRAQAAQMIYKILISIGGEI